ncbi:MAG: hypothetical protein GQE15_07100 [Archangiaceae bacterium]|nr:hypothetical protein [Archangiaceae bacterium]
MKTGPTTPAGEMRPIDVDIAFAYLLGELPDDRASQLEDEAFDNDERFEELRAYEVELMDAYLSGELSKERSDRFDTKLKSDPELRARLNTARAFKLKVKAAPVKKASWFATLFTSRRFPLAFATGLAVAGATVMVLWPRPMTDSEVSLRPLAVRAEAAARTVKVGKSTRTVKLELSLDGEPARASWNVVVSGPSGEVWRGAPVKADAVAVQAEVPGSVFTSGRHSIVLQSNGATVTEYELTIEPE